MYKYVSIISNDTVEAVLLDGSHLSVHVAFNMLNDQPLDSINMPYRALDYIMNNESITLRDKVRVVFGNYIVKDESGKLFPLSPCEFRIKYVPKPVTLKGDVKSIVDKLINDNPTNHIVLVHGCNCMNIMGAGLARRIKEVYPAADAADAKTEKGSKTKLGTMSGATINSNLSVVNLYTQYNYTRDTPMVDYDAMHKCFTTLVDTALSDYIFLVPKYIGCGLAGGDINIVAPIIKECFKYSAYYLFDI